MVKRRVVLVTGLLPYDSGKTWFTLALTRGLLKHSVRVGIYKPVSAHSAWFQYTTVVRSRELGVLVGSDIISYLDLGLINVDSIALSNPIDILTAPRDVKVYLNSLDEYLRSHEDLAKQVVLARITCCQDGTYTHYVVAENVDLAVSTLRAELIALSETLRATSIGIERFFSLLKDRWVDSNLDLCLTRLRSDSDLVVVESFSDSITPYMGLLNKVDLVVVVYPGGALVFDDLEAVMKAIEDSAKRYGDFGLRTSNIIGYGLRVKSMVRLAPRANPAGTLPEDAIKEFMR